MKNYTNSPRKPMMYGGMTSPSMTSQKTQARAKKPRTGAGGSSAPRMTMSSGGQTNDKRRAELKAKYEKGGRDRAEVVAMANGKGRDAMLARSIMAEKGGSRGVANTPPGDQEPAPMAHGGKHGGKLKMVEKDGKKVPFYAADGKGKAMYGGKVKKRK